MYRVHGCVALMATDCIDHTLNGMKVVCISMFNQVMWHPTVWHSAIVGPNRMGIMHATMAKGQCTQSYLQEPVTWLCPPAPEFGCHHPRPTTPAPSHLPAHRPALCPPCASQMMTDIAHRLEADINELCKRMQSAGGGAPASQEAIDGPPAADAAPAGGSGGLVPQLSGNRVDLAFLQQLVEAEGSDTPTSSPSGEDNGEGGSQLSGDQGGQGGERLAHAAAAAEEAVNGPEVLGGAVEADGAVPERNQQQQHHQQERLQRQAWGREEALNDLLRRQSATSSGRSSDAVCDVGAQPPCKRARQCLPSPALQQQVQAVASPVKQQQMLAAPHPVAAEGPAAPGASSSLQLHAAGHAMGRGKGTGSLLKAQNPIASQAQVALTTWENLIASAATPSTVMAQLPATTACTQTTESSVA